MATITCKYSGIQFNCDFFPIHLSSGEYHHPIFSAPLKRLFRYFPKWQAGELTEVDSYLYFLALLNSTDLVEFRTSAKVTEKTNQIVSSNMEALFYTIGKIVTIRHPKFSVPSLVISEDSCDLLNVHHWINSWESCYMDFCNGLKEAELRSKLQRKESALEKLIKNPSLKPERYAHILADWAAEAASFPEFTVKDQNGIDTTLSEYWKSIILLCYKKESLLSVPESDLIELLEHCETEIDLGSIQSYHLFNTLRDGLDTLQNFFGNNETTTFKILTDDSSISDANLELLIQSASNDRPKRTEFATEFAFLKAKMKWEIAQNAARQIKSIDEEL